MTGAAAEFGARGTGAGVGTGAAGEVEVREGVYVEA